MNASLSHPKTKVKGYRLQLTPIDPRQTKNFLIFSTLFDLILLYPPIISSIKESSDLYSTIQLWIPTILILIFPVSMLFHHKDTTITLARYLIKKRLQLLSSPRFVNSALTLISFTLLLEGAFAIGRKHRYLLILGCLLAIPGTMAIVKAFQRQFKEVHASLQSEENFERTVQKTSQTLIHISLLSARLSGPVISISLLPTLPPHIAMVIGIASSIALLSTSPR